MKQTICMPARSVVLFALLISTPAIASSATAPSIQTRKPVGRVDAQVLKADFVHVLSANKNDPAIAAVEQRLTSMDETADLILRDLRLHRMSFLDQSLATVSGPQPGAANANDPLGAAKIVEKERASFEIPIAWGNLPSADRQVSERYIDAARTQLITLIRTRARSCMSVAGVNAAEIFRLAFVMQLLVNESNQDLSTPPTPLPKWMTNPAALHVLQTFAVESDVPRVAFTLMEGHAPAATEPDPSVRYLTFARQQADAMLRTAHYQAAITCLHDAIAVATSTRKDADAIHLAVHVAQVLEASQSAAAAAEQMARVQAMSHTDDDYGRASTLRLKYLYEAGQHQLVVNEAAADLKDARCASYLPQIIYAGWLACLRTDGAGVAASWRNEFLHRFPDDPLAAEMYLAAAKDALAANDANEASRVLRFIEYRFPQSRVIDEVRLIEQRLNAATGTAPTAPQ